MGNSSEGGMGGPIDAHPVMTRIAASGIGRFRLIFMRRKNKGTTKACWLAVRITFWAVGGDCMIRLRRLKALGRKGRKEILAKFAENNGHLEAAPLRYGMPRFRLPPLL